MPADARDLRCSDAERDLVAEVVRQAAGDGRLTLDELDQRLDSVYSARTYRDLESAVADLPGARLPGPPAAAPQPPSGEVTQWRANPVVASAGPGDSAVAVFSEAKRGGAWVVPPDYSSVAVFGSVELDVREASFAANVVQIQANAVFGEVTLLVGDGVTVNVAGTPVLGEYKGPNEEATPDRPHVVVNGIALFGSVEVKRKAPKGRRRWGGR